MSDDGERLRDGAVDLGVRLTESQVRQFRRYGEMLEEWNARFNLTRVPPEDYVTLHYLDSLAAARAYSFADSDRLIDVGTGAGMPGIPLKIAFPHLRVTLLDSTLKRLRFLDAVIEHLGLDGIRTLHARAEVASRTPEHRAHYDAAIARAVAKLPVLVTWLLPFVQPGGSAIALKSAGVEEEAADSAAAARKLGAEYPESVLTALPGTEITRTIIIFSKSEPVRFPR